MRRSDTLVLALAVIGMLFLPMRSLAQNAAGKRAARPPQYPRVTTDSGLIYQDIRIGKGPIPKSGQMVICNYEAYLLHGRMFDSSYNRKPFAFILGDNAVIKGWEEGISTMRVGGKRRLIIPPSLGYGDNIVGTIPPDSTLDFRVELLDVKDIGAPSAVHPWCPTACADEALRERMRIPLVAGSGPFCRFY